jgi:hypothetical protein
MAMLTVFFARHVRRNAAPNADNVKRAPNTIIFHCTATLSFPAHCSKIVSGRMNPNSSA